MRILLTNDDGIYAPGLAAMERELQHLGDVSVVAPATEQSGVAHSITFLSPLICKEVYENDHRRGWAVEGSPADCVRIGICELCPERPDLVVSGINGGLNAGINVMYSGTVAAAIEGALFEITSIAVSLENEDHANFSGAAKLATQIISQLLEQTGPAPQLYNLNLPTSAVGKSAEVKIVPMGISHFGEQFIQRKDPKGRPYYWAITEPSPPPESEETDLTALKKGFITITPLDYDKTHFNRMAEMKKWNIHSEV